MGQQEKDLLEIEPVIRKVSGKIIILTLGNYIYVKQLKRIFPKHKIYSISSFFFYKYKFLGLLLFFKYLLKNFLSSKKNKGIVYSKIFFKTCLDHALYYDLSNKIITKKIFFDNSANKFLFQKIYKMVNKDTMFYSYSLNGLYLSNDQLVSNYLYNNIDVLFCYGQGDSEVLRKIKSINSAHYPRDIIEVGSVRNYFFKKKFKKRKNRIKKILYIKSNPSLIDNIDNKSLELLLNSLRKIKAKFEIIVKERPVQTELNFKHRIIKNNLLKLDQVIFNKDIKTEELICSSDIICGTLTSSFMQGIYFNKLVVQINSNKMFWNNFKKKKLLGCNDALECKKVFNKIHNNANYKKYLNKQQIIKNKIFRKKKNPTKLIVSILENKI